MEGVGGEVGGVALGGGETADCGFDGVDVEGGRLEHGGAVDRLGDGGGRGLGRTAALGVEADRGDPLALDREGEAREIAAGRAAGSAGESVIGRRPAPALVA